MHAPSPKQQFISKFKTVGEDQSGCRQGDDTLYFVEGVIAWSMAAIPSDAQKDDGWLKVAPFERGLILFQEYDSERRLDELTRVNIAGEAIPATLPKNIRNKRKHENSTYRWRNNC